MTNKQKALVFLVLGSISSAGFAASSKIGLREIPPISFVFLRFLIASICIFPFVLKGRKKILRQIIALAPLSLLATFNVVLYVFGIRLTTATIGQLLYAGSPLLVGLLGYVFYKEKLSYKEICGIIIGFIGILVVVFLPILEKGTFFSGNLTGNALISVGVILYATYLVFSGRYQRENSPFALVASFILTTTIVLSPFSFLELFSHPLWWEKISVVGVVAIIYGAIVATIFSYLANQYAIKHGGAVYASLTFYLLPIFAYLAAHFLLGEQLTTGIIIGGILALFGIFLTTRR